MRKLVWVRKEWITTSSKKLLRLRNAVCTVCHIGLGLHRAYVFFFLLLRCIPSSKCRPSGRKLRSTFSQFSVGCVSSALNVGEPLHCCCGIAAAFSSGYRRSERRPTSNEKGSIWGPCFQSLSFSCVPDPVIHRAACARILQPCTNGRAVLL